MQFPEKLVRFIPNAGNPFSRSEAKKFKPEVNALGFFMPAIRSGLLGRDVLHDTLKPYTRRVLNQIAGLAHQVERLPCKQDVGGSIPSTSTR